MSLNYIKSRYLVLTITSFLVSDDNRITPGYTVLPLGNSLTLTCESDGSIRWFILSKSSSLTLPETWSKIYEINGASLEDGGDYYCYGRINGTGNSFLAGSLVDINGELFVDIYFLMQHATHSDCIDLFVSSITF